MAVDGGRCRVGLPGGTSGGVRGRGCAREVGSTVLVVGL
jgi:hypothetical protein